MKQMLPDIKHIILSNIDAKLYSCILTSCKMKKALSSRRRKHCALAVVRRRQKISPRRPRSGGGAGRPKFNQLEMVTTFTYKPSLVKIDTHNFELSW